MNERVANMKNLMISGFVTLASVASLQAAVFPAGSTDLAATDETGWNSDVPADAKVKYSATLKASSDVTFSTIQFGYEGWSSGIYTLDLTPEASGAGRKITITANDTWTGLKLYNIYSGTKDEVLVKGGLIDFSGTAGAVIGGSWKDYGVGADLTFDGTIITNAARLMAGETAQTAARGITLKGGTRAYLKEKDAYTPLFYGNASNRYFTVTEKSSIAFTKPLYMRNAEGWKELQINVLDGSSMTMASPAYWGETSASRILFSGEATTVSAADSLYYCWKSGIESDLIVEKGATFTVGGSLVTGSGTYRGRNRVIVRENGTLEAGSLFVGSGNQAVGSPIDLVVSNGTLNCSTTFKFGYYGSSDSRILVTGPNSVFKLLGSTSYQAFFDAGKRLSMTIDDGAKVNIGTRVFGYGLSSDDCELRVCNGAELSVSNAFYLGAYWRDQAAIEKGNRLVVENDAKLLVTDGFSVHCANALVAVSNATVSVIGATFGYYNTSLSEDPGVSTNDTLVVRGSTPTLAVTNALRFENKSHVRYELAAGGYAADFVPVKAGSITLNAGCSLEIDLSRYLTDESAAPDRATMTLARASSALTLDADALAAARASVQEQLAASEKFKGDLAVVGNDLVLTVKKITGLILILR